MGTAQAGSDTSITGKFQTLLALSTDCQSAIHKMPLYKVEHSFPLTKGQKTDLAERITKLHGTRFTTPSMYVQVKFVSQDPSHHNHYVAGKARTQSSNRIIGYVRSGSTRPQSAFEDLAEQIEHAWYVVLEERFEGTEEEIKKKEKESGETSEKERYAKELLSVAFVPGLIGREKGYTWPEVSKLPCASEQS